LFHGHGGHAGCAALRPPYIFIEDAKSSGLVQQIIDRFELKGIQVAGAKISGSR